MQAIGIRQMRSRFTDYSASRVSASGSERTFVHNPAANPLPTIVPGFHACFSEVFFGLQRGSSHVEIHTGRQDYWRRNRGHIPRDRWSSSLQETHSKPLGARSCRALRHCAPVDHLLDHLWRRDRLAGGHGAVETKLPFDLTLANASTGPKFDLDRSRESGRLEG